MQEADTRDQSGKTLVTENLTYAAKLAHQFYRERRNLGVDLEDLIGAAHLGLCDAARRYDPAKGQSFRTFGYFRIRGAMYDLLRRAGAVPRAHFDELITKNSSNDTSKPKQKAPKKSAKLPYRIATDAVDLARLATVIEDSGIRVHVGTDHNTVEISYAHAPSPEHAAISSSLNRYVERLLEQLPEKEREIIEHRYYEERTFDEMKDLFGDVSKSWLSRLHLRALNTLRERILEKNGTPRAEVLQYAS